MPRRIESQFSHLGRSLFWIQRKEQGEEGREAQLVGWPETTGGISAHLDQRSIEDYRMWNLLKPWESKMRFFGPLTSVFQKLFWKTIIKASYFNFSKATVRTFRVGLFWKKF
ncbi:hypothetical protein LINGRAHAP2_LOCUS22738, partial [Linum grandiflorum]